jgi:transcriptional regulator with XRE-family HTH domain
MLTLMSKGKTLGSLVGAIRRSHNWTLKQMSEVVGIPLSTLSKVESDKLSLSYDKIQMMAQSLGMSMADFFGQTEASDASVKAVTARRSLTGPDNSVTVETQNYRYDYLCSDLTQKRMVPIITEVRARSAEEFGDAVTHPGEEFIFVLEGEIQVTPTSCTIASVRSCWVSAREMMPTSSPSSSIWRRRSRAQPDASA